MSGKRYRPEEIISKLREAEALLTEGVSVGEVIYCLCHGIRHLSLISEYTS